MAYCAPGFVLFYVNTPPPPHHHLENFIVGDHLPPARQNLLGGPLGLANFIVGWGLGVGGQGHKDRVVPYFFRMNAPTIFEVKPVKG